MLFIVVVHVKMVGFRFLVVFFGVGGTRWSHRQETLRNCMSKRCRFVDMTEVPHVSCIPCLSVVVASNYITQDLSCCVVECLFCMMWHCPPPLSRKIKKGWFQQQLLQTCYDHLEVSLWGIQQDRIALLQLVNMACQSQPNWVECECVLWCHISTNRKLKVTPCSTNDWLQKVN